MAGRDWLLLVTLSVLWGGSFFFSEVALGELGPFTVVLGRVGIAAVALVAFVYLSGRRMPGAPGLWGAFLVMGALNNLIPFSLIVWGQVTIDSGLASILNATTPLFTVVLAHLLTRDERMTRGRKREHYQWNMDIWGETSVTAEAELIAAVFDLLDALGLARRDVKIRISSRALLEETLRNTILADRPEAFPGLCVAIDKHEKIGEDAVRDLLTDSDGPVGLGEDDARFVISWLGLRKVEDAARHVPPDSRAFADLQRLFNLLDTYGLADRVVFDASIVRGLAYYTGIVFEAFDADRKLRALCGGGRYDRLIESLGGSAIPAVGFGFGDVVIGELLSDKKLLPEPPRQLDAVVFPFGDDERAAAIRVANALRRERQWSIELVLGTPRLRRVLADAHRAGARFLYVLGPDELSRGE
ncbi:MAG: ATP phosphoribosyltransferase regulatory subunit, partial [Proteobacteria bacterium]|nr:ATP phosphoribosyltransferase regulatory subunit [Pseudomonadota bacterium]